MRSKRQQERAATPAVAAILIVAITVILATVVAAQFLGFTSKIGGPTSQATFEYAESPVGLQMTPEQIAQDVAVEINGKQVATFDRSDAGNGKLIPTSPGDQLTVVAADGSRSVLVSRTVDERDEIGDFIAHYTFEEGSGTTLYDRSGNENHGDISDPDPDWITGSDTGLAFDGTGDHVNVDNLETPGFDVSEFTIAVAYKTNTGSQKQELVELISGSDNWGLELKTDSATTYDPGFFADENGGSQSGQIFTGIQSVGNRQVLVGTYDGSQIEVFVDGNSRATGSFSSEINMEDMHIGEDAEGSIDDYLDGEIYEIRLYYSAFDDNEVESITKAME